MSRTMLLASLLVVALVAGCTSEDGGNDMTPTPAGTTTPATSTPASTPAGTPAVVDPTPTISSVLVGSDAAYPPFEDTVGDDIVGFDVDVMQEIANRSGFTMSFQNAVFDTIITSVQNGQFQVGASAFTITEERRQQVDFTVPYYENRLLVAVRSDDTSITAEEDLAGKRVCTQSGTTSEFYLRDQLGFTDDDLQLVPTAPQCAEALQRGDVAALMIDAAFVRNVIESSNGELKQAFSPIDADEQFGFVVAKGNPELLTAMNAALVAMQQDGTLDELAEKWKV